MSDSVLAWHFSDGELRFDYAGVKVEAGLVLETQEKPVIGRKGFHASVSAIDALNWFSVSPSKKIIVSRVKLSGAMVKGDWSSYGERLSTQRREHLWVADSADTIENFVFWASSQLLKNLRELDVQLDNRLEDILNIRKRWRTGEVSAEERKAMDELKQDILKRAKHIAASIIIPDYVEGFWEIPKRFKDTRDFVSDVPEQIIAGLEQENNGFASNILRFYPALISFIKLYSKNKGNAELNPDTQLHEMLMRLAPEGYEE